MAIHFELVTPERVLFRQEVDQVTVPTTEGEITILPHHIGLVAILTPGVIRLKKQAIEEDVVVSGGCIQVETGDRVRVLADMAERGFELHLPAIEEAKLRAERAMQDAAAADDTAYAAAAALLERELARYRVARKYHGSSRVPRIDAAEISHNENVI